MKIITRYAPSPTGDPHIGNIRTALFAYLFARSGKGQFLLRVEDTDQERSIKGSVETILQSLDWLGMKPDNSKEIVYQSKRLAVYKETALKLLRSGDAYICNCSKQRLEDLRKEQEAKKLPTGYDGHCRDKFKTRISKSEINSKSENQIPQTVEELDSVLATGAVVRMKMPKKGKIKFSDLIRGEVEFDLALIDDQVIVKSDGYPTYHLASVVDDGSMNISHVIRGEEWLSSTPKHLILWRMLEKQAPQYAHLPLILGADKKKLSKRHGALSVLGYKKAGYLPEALVNFIAFLGWNPKDEREIFSMEELEKEFKIENINKAPAVFNIEKLNSLNELYLKSQISNLKIKSQNSKLLEQFGVKNISDGEIELLGRGGYSTLKEMAEEILSLGKEPVYDGKLLVFKKSTKQTTLKGLEKTRNKIQDTNQKDWNGQELQMQLGLIVERNDLNNGDVFWPVRVALSGREKSPSPVELLVALGKKESVNRLQKAIDKLKH